MKVNPLTFIAFSVILILIPTLTVAKALLTSDSVEILDELLGITKATKQLVNNVEGKIDVVDSGLVDVTDRLVNQGSQLDRLIGLVRNLNGSLTDSKRLEELIEERSQLLRSLKNFRRVLETTQHECSANFTRLSQECHANLTTQSREFQTNLTRLGIDLRNSQFDLEMCEFTQANLKHRIQLIVEENADLLNRLASDTARLQLQIAQLQHERTTLVSDLRVAKINQTLMRTEIIRLRNKIDILTPKPDEDPNFTYSKNLILVKGLNVLDNHGPVTGISPYGEWNFKPAKYLVNNGYVNRYWSYINKGIASKTDEISSDPFLLPDQLGGLIGQFTLSNGKFRLIRISVLFPTTLSHNQNWRSAAKVKFPFQLTTMIQFREFDGGLTPPKKLQFVIDDLGFTAGAQVMIPVSEKVDSSAIPPIKLRFLLYK